MPYCPKCGNKVAEEMEYCPKCGASLKAEKVPRREVSEKQEKQEKQEKGEKHEKSEVSRFWAIMGGLVLVVLGAVSLATIALKLSEQWRGALLLVTLGIILIVFALYGATRASQRHPQP